jgi:hypothetical protein
MIRNFIFIFFCLLSFGWLLTSHDYIQYFIHFDQFINLVSKNSYSSYMIFVGFMLLFLKSGTTFVYVLWALNWISVYFFFIYKNKFNAWFLLSYFIIFSYLWHSNQLRQGFLMPVLIHLYYNRLKLSNKKIILYAILLSTWHLSFTILLTFFKNVIDFNKRFIYLLPFLMITSFIIGGRVSLFNITSFLVLISFLLAFKLNLKSLNLPLLFFCFFLVFRYFEDGILASRMLELSCLILPFILIYKKDTSVRIALTIFSLIITINNSLFS